MLSILIPTYNYNIYPLVTELYKQCSESSISFEIIVVDDSPGSLESKESSDILQFQNCIYIVNETNLGRTLTRKKLAEQAKYDMLLFLDADVLPASSNFIADYIPYIANKSQLVFGGYAYREEDNHNNSGILRLKYGMQREEKPASERRKAPYSTIFSGNLLLQQSVFIENNYNAENNFYGMDNFFSYNLYINKVKIIHIDNPIYHLGLESDAVFFRKCLQSVVSRKQFLAKAEGIENVNGLLKHYKKLKKYGLTGLTRFSFKLAEPFLKKMILKKNPNLFCLDLYRLGYICSI